MSKTPIMILQEIGMKECVLPKYDIIHSQTDTHEIIFTFRVKYNDKCADGSASNKKEAKQNAAQNMLKLLQETKSISFKGLSVLELTDSCVNTENVPLYSSNPIPLNITNYVGILQEYCAQNRLVEPEYRICEAEGPAHNVKFKMSCTLGSITEEAIANTKKKAKQLVAQKILQNLPNIPNITHNDQYKVSANSSSEVETTEAAFKNVGIQLANLKIIDSIPIKDIKLKYLNATSKENLLPLADLHLNISMTNYHLHFKSFVFNRICNSKEKEMDVLYDTFKAYLKKYRTLEKNNETILHEYRQILTHIKEKCSLSIKKISLSSKTNMTIIGFRINLMIPFVQFGISYNPVYAEQEALANTIEAIMLYLK